MKKIDDKYFIKDNKVNYNPSIDLVLTSDETILWKGKPRKLSFILSNIFKFLPFAIIWLIFDITAIVMIFKFMSEIPLPAIIFIVFFFILHLLPVWLWISSLITASRRQKVEEYAFTGNRIIIKSGFIGANISSINYSSISSVNLKIGLVERLCKVGDIYIVADNKKYILEDIKDPYFIYERLQKIANDIKSDIIYPNNYRPSENNGYKTSYNPKEVDKINKKDE